MRRRWTSDARILFPWEGRRGFSRLRGLGRLRPVFVGLAVVGLVVVIGVRERRKAGIRHTRAVLIDVRRAVDAYLAEHDGACPPALTDVLPFTHMQEVPADAWGQPLRFTCPARLGQKRYQLMSDGPDGKPGGLDRVE